ncbi:hypothetical protein EVAR_91848_1 [Eumeta japonica]|uniref:Uncharacterized protein n=1 Tax=Eumeta variegata TaxID=151549 RepID=A0A4C2AAV8_EUMVA|nr:hypothetical protein EVAR_91848_1 [Eumeta japonica]
MPESYDTAMRRLRSIEKKLSKNDNLKREYCEQINNLLKNGYAEPAPNQSTSERLWYLPHFAVTHPQKKKVRLVFDAAARTNGKCLNDALLTGPDLIRSLLGVLVRFRQGRVAVSADIKEMFLRWDINNDALGFNLGLRNTPTEVLETSLPPTKRQVTSAVMSVFDPLGLASPVLITGKCMLQDIWRSGIDWDETIEADAHKKWLKWVNDIKKLASIRIPRCISPGHTEGELHVFVDASEKSYAAAVYWRIKLSEHESAVSLIAGKARVAPLKVISIPRLELQAALLGARLASSILTEIELNVTRKIFWTDSRTVLSWIRSDPRSFKPFVAHRLAELEEHTTVKCWRWVPTKLNVADDATRDPPTHFDETHRWFHGPDFLRKSEDEWPQETVESERPTGGGEIMYDVDTGQ